MSSEHVKVLQRMANESWRGSPEHAALTAAIASLSAPQSGDAESKLAEAGVFAGHHGLRGLADAAEFWEKQPYGTRLYYGDGGMDYLHRGVLQKAVEILDAAPQPPAEAQPVGVEGFRDWVIEQMPAGTVIDNPELWAERLARAYELNVPSPSAPVGVWDLPGKWRAEVEAAEPGVEKSYLSDYWLAHLHVAEELEEALAQQPAAVDEAIAWVRLSGSQGDPPGAMTVTAELRDGREIVLIRDNGNEIDHAVNLSAALAAKPGGSDNDR